MLELHIRFNNSILKYLSKMAFQTVGFRGSKHFARLKCSRKEQTQRWRETIKLNKMKSKDVHLPGKGFWVEVVHIRRASEILTQGKQPDRVNCMSNHCKLSFHISTDERRSFCLQIHILNHSTHYCFTSSEPTVLSSHAVCMDKPMTNLIQMDLEL